ncbi:cation channel sperm-associated protein 2 isoform X6 [Fukomys damarensis]|uniref:cation channel sperm-associated protein 2 isoform X6 n=1 Tax=Fukomys damarensis TaxID=885580 RepID=UPI0008FECC24|nr:cation channel sperm-associated protein 2 isoform X6 [Fukomys damarensis]
MATDHPGHMHLPRADAIHSRRVDLEFFQDSSQPVPLFTTREILDPSYQKPIGLRDQHQQVLFSTKPRHLGRVSHAQRLLCRFNVRHSPWPPLSLWAEWVIEHPWFKNFINFLIILNVVVRMVIIELLDSTNNSLWPLKLSLEVAVWFILPIFIVEILLKWVASFSLFWKNAWNVFDFVVTLLPLLYEILVLGGVTGHPVWLELLSICGVMRCFRLYAQLHQVRVIILALVRTFKGPAKFPNNRLHPLHHGSLELAAPGHLEGAGSQLGHQQHLYHPLGASGLHYLAKCHNKHDGEVSRHRTSLDFQEASSEKESKHSTVEKEVTLSSKPTKESLFKRKESSSSSSTSSSSSEYGDQVDWENLVHQNLPELMEMDQDQYTLWPRNLLLRYLELLEELQYNLEERKELQRLAGTDEIPKEVTPTTNGFKIFGPSKR